MLGYWRNEQATRETVDEDGWLHTGDIARIEKGHIYIVGRLKEIIVLSTGEKIAPADMEMMATDDPLFEQVFIHGEGRPYLTALVSPHPERWERFLKGRGVADPAKEAERVEELVLERLEKRLAMFPSYAAVRRARVIDEPWTIDNGLLTPTLKLRRNSLLNRYRDIIEALYEGH